MRTFRLYGNNGKDPYVHAENGHIEIIGRITEYSDYLKLLLEWVKEYKESPLEYTELIVNLDYISSTPEIILHQILRELEGIEKRGYKVCVRWIYEEDDSDYQEKGEDMKSILKISNFIVSVDKNYLREKKLKRILLDENDTEE